MTDIERRIKKIIETISGVSSSEIESWTTAEHLGLDSFDGVELIMEIEKEFAISITDNEAEKMNTVSDVVSYIEKKIAMEQNVTDPNNYEKIILDEIAKQIKKRVNRNAQWKSLVYVGGLVNTLNNRFGVQIKLDDTTLQNIRSVGTLVSYINSVLKDAMVEKANQEPETMRIITDDDILSAIAKGIGSYYVLKTMTFEAVGLDDEEMLTDALSEIDKQFGVNIDYDDVDCNTVGDLVDLVKKQLTINQSMSDRKYQAEVTNEMNISNEEREYIEEFKDVISEGNVSDRDLRFLAKIRKAYGISDERAAELEAMATAPLQDINIDCAIEMKEAEILDIISQVVGKNVTREKTFYDVGLTNYGKKTELKIALNERFGLSLYETSLNFGTIGQLVDYLKTQIPQIDRSTSESHSESHSIISNDNSTTGEDLEAQILSTIAGALKMKTVLRDYSYSFLGLDLDSILVWVRNALNDKFNLELQLEDMHFFNIGGLVDYVEEQITGKNQNKCNSEATYNDKNMSKKYEWAITPDKNKHEYVIGIDFGHGETSAAFCSIGWESTKGQLGPVKDIDFGSNTKVIPSAISITTDGKAYIGDAAFLPEVLNKAEANVCFKKKPENIDGSAEQLMMRFMKEVYNTIRERNSALFTDGNHLVYIATPSGWDDTAKDLYGQMAAKAGLPMGGITSESRAAFIKAQQDPDSGLPQYIDKGAIVFDMGSSTLDFTYLTRDNVNPIDWGDDCGASKVEKIIYASKRDGNEEIIDFEKKYPNLVDALLFEARKAKEKVYFHPDMPCRITVNFETIVEDEEFEDTKMKFKYQPGELNQMLEEKGYIGAIRNAMMIFKNEKITGKPIHVAFLTGGASRMDFIKDLVKECWNLPDERIYRDQDPSLTISQGVAVLGRGDIRSGGAQNTKSLLDEITKNAEDIFTPFAESLTAKVTDELERSVVTAFNEFRDCESDVSLNDLQERMKWWAEQDTNSIGEWASECYQKAFEEKTADIRAKLDSVVNEFSSTGVQMGSVGNVSLSLPQLDMRGITAQMEEIGTTFAAEAGSITETVASAAIGGAIGYGLGMLLGGPLAWLLIGGYFIGKWLFGEEETEEQKKQKAMAIDLDKSARQQIYDAFFAEKGDEVANKIATSVHSAIYDNPSLKKKINEQSLKVIRDYAQECINQTRLMVE